MFCTKCGKEIDSDSMFCPYCGQKTAAPVENRSSKKKVSVKMSGKKVIGGIAVAVAVLLAMFGISKIIGGISDKNKSMAEKVFEMPIEDMAKLSIDDFQDMFDNEGKLHAMDSFKGYDCLIGYRGLVPDTIFRRNSTLWGCEGVYFTVAFETAEDYKEGQKVIEKYLEKSLVNKSPVLETYSLGEGRTKDIYLIECSDKGVEDWKEKTRQFNTFFAEYINDNKKDYKMYKFVQIYYSDEFDVQSIFPSDKTYTDYVCHMTVYYLPMTEEEYTSCAGLWGYDAISHEEIDIENFKDSVNEELVKFCLDRWEKAGNSKEYCRILEEQMYRKLYMMEKHNLDIEYATYLKTDEEKKIWYIDNFNWDIDTDTKIDVSD